LLFAFAALNVALRIQLTKDPYHGRIAMLGKCVT
jgi:hypothetical protein